MYFVGKDGKQTGPFSVQQLRTMALQGDLLTSDLVWSDRMVEWQPATAIDGVFGLTSYASGAQLAPPKLPNSTKSWGLRHVMLACSICLFLCSFVWIKTIESRYANIEAEIEEKNSAGSIFGSMVKSSFNGFTFGAFDQEGIFGESDRLDRWQAWTRSRISSLKVEYDIANSIWWISLLIGIVCLLVVWAYSSKSGADGFV